MFKTIAILMGVLFAAAQASAADDAQCDEPQQTLEQSCQAQEDAGCAQSNKSAKDAREQAEGNATQANGVTGTASGSAEQDAGSAAGLATTAGLQNGQSSKNYEKAYKAVDYSCAKSFPCQKAQTAWRNFYNCKKQEQQAKADSMNQQALGFQAQQMAMPAGPAPTAEANGTPQWADPGQNAAVTNAANSPQAQWPDPSQNQAQTTPTDSTQTQAPAPETSTQASDLSSRPIWQDSTAIRNADGSLTFPNSSDPNQNGGQATNTGNTTTQTPTPSQDSSTQNNGYVGARNDDGSCSYDHCYNNCISNSWQCVPTQETVASTADASCTLISPCRSALGIGNALSWFNNTSSPAPSAGSIVSNVYSYFNGGGSATPQSVQQAANILRSP